MAYSTPYNYSTRAQTTNFSYSNNDLNMYFLSKIVKVPYVLNYTKTEPNGSWSVSIIYGTDSIAYCFYPNNPTNDLWSSGQTMMLNNFYLTIGDTTKKPSDVTPQKSPNVDIYIVSAGAPGSYYGDGGGGGWVLYKTGYSNDNISSLEVGCYYHNYLDWNNNRIYCTGTGLDINVRAGIGGSGGNNAGGIITNTGGTSPSGFNPYGGPRASVNDSTKDINPGNPGFVVTQYSGFTLSLSGGGAGGNSFDGWGGIGGFGGSMSSFGSTANNDSRNHNYGVDAAPGTNLGTATNNTNYSNQLISAGCGDGGNHNYYVGIPGYVNYPTTTFYAGGGGGGGGNASNNAGAGTGPAAIILIPYYN